MLFPPPRVNMSQRCIISTVINPWQNTYKENQSQKLKQKKQNYDMIHVELDQQQL